MLDPVEVGILILGMKKKAKELEDLVTDALLYYIHSC